MSKIRWRLVIGLISFATAVILTTPMAATRLADRQVQHVSDIWPNVPDGGRLVSDIWPNVLGWSGSFDSSTGVDS